MTRRGPAHVNNGASYALVVAFAIASCSSGSSHGQKGGTLPEPASDAGLHASDAGVHASDAGGPDTNTGTGGNAGSRDAGHDASAATEEATARTVACYEYMRAFCERRVECHGLGTSPSDCIQENAALCPDVMFADGSTRTPDGTLACAEMLRSQGCNDMHDHVGLPCSTPGTRQPGEACIGSFQCASLGCSSAGNSCGTCGRRPGDGEACDPQQGIFCASGYACDSGSHTCARAPDGGSPDPAAPMVGDACDPTSGIDCGSLDCKRGADDMYRCAEYPKLGEDCSEPLTCEMGGPAYCDLTQQCLALPKAGEACGVDAFTGQAGWCGRDSNCDDSVDPPRCRALPGPGEACTLVCRDDLSCKCDDDACSTRTCLRIRVGGESCSDPADRCLSGAARCENGVCVWLEWQGLEEKLCTVP